MASFDVVARCIEKIRGRGLRVVFPEGGDERIVAAAKRLREERIAEPIVLAEIEPGDRLDAYAGLYLKSRPDSNPKVARRLAAKPLFHAGLMLRAGDADAMLAGVTGSMPCLMNAIADAMRQGGVTRFDMPATQDRVWAALQAAKAGKPQALAVTFA